MKRVLTSAVLIPLVLYAIFGPHRWLLFAVIAVFAVVCFQEYSRIATGFQMPVPQVPGIVAGLAMLVVPRDTQMVLLAATLLWMSWEMRAHPLAEVLPRSAAMAFGLVYIFGTWKCGLLLGQTAPWWLMFAIGINWVGDISAYYGGRAFGKHKLAPLISPGKTWEGAIASAVVSVSCALPFFSRFMPHVPLIQAVPLALAVNIAGQIGDLVESALKRGAGVKDSGTLLPGHGGFLDRVDSSLFTMPVVYLYLQM